MEFSIRNKNIFIQNLVEVQRQSFYDLLETGIKRQLLQLNYIENKQKKLKLTFHVKNYKFLLPKLTPKDALVQSKSFDSPLYIPVEYKIKNELTLCWVHIGNLPLMTKRGHFIVKGIPRVILNQMVRSPGIYYKNIPTEDENFPTFYSDIIPYRGTWLRLEIDKKNQIWARMKRIGKIPMMLFLQALGYDFFSIEKLLYSESILDNSYLYETNHPSDQKSALKKIKVEIEQDKILKLAALEDLDEDDPNVSKRLTQIKENTTSDMGKEFLFHSFFNPASYDLSEVGRFQFNKKLNLSIPETHTVLTEFDIYFATYELIKRASALSASDDIDHLVFRRVRTCGELLENQLGEGFSRLIKILVDKISKSVFYSPSSSPSLAAKQLKGEKSRSAWPAKGNKKKSDSLPINGLIAANAVNGALQEFFGSSPLSQFMDQINPLSEITHKRRISSMGPGGVNKDNASMAVRSIHPTHYGRICPIETPEGHNAGLVNSPTIYARRNKYGFLETPFFKVSNGQIQVTSPPIFLTAQKEQKFKVSPPDLNNSILNFLPGSSLPMRKDFEFRRVSANQIELLSISPLQMISVATSLIPFLEHDDANRALMGSNMQRQAVPLLTAERAIVGTGLEGRVIADSGYIVQAKSSGIVSYVSNELIIVQTFSIHKDGPSTP